MKKNEISVLKKEEQEIPAEKIAQAIMDIQKAIDQMNRSSLKRETLVSLIHDNSKVAKSTIRIILNNLDSLKENYLKKEKP